MAHDKQMNRQTIPFSKSKKPSVSSAFSAVPFLHKPSAFFRSFRGQLSTTTPPPSRQSV